MDTNELIINIATDICSAGGVLYLVGGCVRDNLLHQQCKDVDVEIFALSPEKIEAILEKYGEVIQKGVSFPVYSIKGYEIDFSLPRKETKIGNKHTDFRVIVNPLLSTKEASKRRDFTVNALMYNPLTELIVDEWGGIKDLNGKFLRHVNEEKFAEDALRVFRCARFAATLGFSIDRETIRICEKIDTSYLSKERIASEMNKVLLEAEKPSIFFKALLEMNQLDVWMPELKALVGIQQSKVHHPEGDAFQHTMMVVDEAAKWLKTSRVEKPLAFMLSALCHDFGKAVTTTISDDGKIQAIKHDVEGVPLAEKFIVRIYGQTHMLPYIKDMVDKHMKLRQYANSNSREKKTRALFDTCANPNDLCLLVYADSRGRLTTEEEKSKGDLYIHARYHDYLNWLNEPKLKAKDFLALGYNPGPKLGKILKRARELSYGKTTEREIFGIIQKEFQKN